MQTTTVSAEGLAPGAWTSRWGAWMIVLQTIDRAWHTRVWSWTEGTRVMIAKWAVLATSRDAVTWACEVLRQHGARVFVDGREQPLEKFLVFTPGGR